MRTNNPVVHAAGITLSWFALPLLLFLGSSSPDSASRATQNTPDGLNPGPDVIVGDLSSLQQFGSNGTQVGLAMGTDTCNNGDVELNFCDAEHRSSGPGAKSLSHERWIDQRDRFEQIGQSWPGHGFFALQNNACGFGCIPASNGTHLGAGCSTADSAGINAGPANLGSRAWVNPFTGVFPSRCK